MGTSAAAWSRASRARTRSGSCSSLRPCCGPAAHVRGHRAGGRRDRRRAPPPRPPVALVGPATRRCPTSTSPRSTGACGDRVPGRRRELHAAHDRDRLARGRGVRHRPRPHGEPQLVFAAHSETPVISRCTAAWTRRACRSCSRRIPTCRWSRSATASGGSSPTSAGSRPSTTGCRSRGMPFSRPPATTSLRRPDHAREGHQGGDRAQPGDGHAAAGRREGAVRLGARALRGGRPARHRRGRGGVPGRGRPASATRCTRVPWRR